MNLRSRFLRAVPMALLLLIGDTAAQASYIQLTTASQLSGTGAVASYSQPDGSKVASPFVESAGGNTVTFATGSNSAFTVLHEGVSFFGDFTSGTPLLYNGGRGPNSISFSLPVNQFGITVESNVIASHVFTISFLSSTVIDLTFSIADGGFSSFFVGAQGTAGNSFNQVKISSDDNDFVIGPASFSAASASTPEPSSWLLSCAGLVLLAWVMKRKARTVYAVARDC